MTLNAEPVRTQLEKLRQIPKRPRPIKMLIRRWWRWAMVMTVICGVGLATSALLAYEPDFYHARQEDLGRIDQAKFSKQFLTTGTRLISDIKNARYWQAEFNEKQINAWLAEDFRNNHADQTLPKEIEDLCVAVDGDLLRLGFRYTQGPVSIIVHVGVRAWVPRPNVLAIEVDGAWAGAVPLSTNHTCQIIERVAHANDLEIVWKRNGQKLVAILQLPRGYHRDVEIQKIEIGSGRVLLAGMSGRTTIASTPDPSLPVALGSGVLTRGSLAAMVAKP